LKVQPALAKGPEMPVLNVGLWKMQLGMVVDDNVQKHPVEHGILEDPTQ